MARNNYLSFILSVSFLLFAISGAEAFHFKDLFGGSSDEEAPASSPMMAPGMESAWAPSPSPMPMLSSHLRLALTPESSPASAPEVPSIAYDVKGQITQFIESNLISAENKTQAMIDGITTKLDDPSSSMLTKECLRQCQDVYEKAVDSVKTGLDSLRTGNTANIEKDIGDVATNVEFCEQCDGEDSQFKAHSNWIKGITNECLAKLETLRS